MEIIEKAFETNGKMDYRNKTERIILHHSDSEDTDVEAIDKWHKAKGWCKIGYHFYVRKDGSIYRGREENTVGAHAYGANYDSIGICAEGRYQEDTMPEAQKQSLKELVAYIKNKYNITLVQKHSDVQATACPGSNYPFDEIANSVENKTKQQTTQIQENNVNKGNVATIQDILNNRYGLNISVDNIYGNETRKALVKALQIELNNQFEKGLLVDGIFGTNTSNACINVRKGANGNITWLIQAMLVCHEFDIAVDGDFGSDTENAVKEFQSRNGLISDGIVGKNTFNKLFK